MLFHLFNKPDINAGVKAWKKTESGVLLDVRTNEEYEEGHIPQSVHIDVSEIQKAKDILKDKDVPLFVHCHSGARSAYAVQLLKRMGYRSVKNIGGIASYTGTVEKGAKK